MDLSGSMYELDRGTWKPIGEQSPMKQLNTAKFAVIQAEETSFLLLFASDNKHVATILHALERLIGLTEQEAIERKAVLGAGLVYASGRVEYGSVECQSRFHRDRPPEDAEELRLANAISRVIMINKLLTCDPPRRPSPTPRRF